MIAPHNYLNDNKDSIDSMMNAASIIAKGLIFTVRGHDKPHIYTADWCDPPFIEDGLVRVAGYENDNEGLGEIGLCNLDFEKFCTINYNHTLGCYFYEVKEDVVKEEFQERRAAAVKKFMDDKASVIKAIENTERQAYERLKKKFEG